MADRLFGRHPSHESTRWSVVEQARSPDAQLRQDALQRLLEHYLPGLRAYLVFQMRIDPDSVDDLLQDFVADRVLTRGLIGDADPQRGKFHIFLRMAVRSFVLDRWRRQQAAKRLPDRAIGLADQIAEALAERPATQPDVDEASHAWQVVVETVGRFRDECQESSRGDLWDLFARRFLRPAAIGAAPEELDQFARRHGLASQTQVSNLLVTIRRRMQKVLRDVMLQYTAAEQVDEAISQLQTQLSAAGVWKAALVGLAAPQMDATMSMLDASTDPVDLRNVVSFLRSDSNEQPLRLAGAVEDLLDTPVELLVSCTPIGATSTDFARRVTLRAVLLGSAGMVDTLTLLKDFAKKRANSSADELPRELCTWLYYASIAAAAIHHSRRITMLRPSALILGIDWLLAQPWLDGASRALFESARKLFEYDPEGQV